MEMEMEMDWFWCLVGISKRHRDPRRGVFLFLGGILLPALSSLMLQERKGIGKC